MRRRLGGPRALLAVTLVVVTAALGVLLGACASGGAWRPFEVAGTIIDKAVVTVPSPLAGGAPREAYVLFVAIGAQVTRGDVAPGFYLAAERGGCVRITGEARGDELRHVVLHLPCGSQHQPPQKGTST